MGEKSVSSSRFLIALTTISTLLLISSTVLLFHTDESSVISSSVFKFIVVDPTAESFKHRYDRNLTVSSPLDTTKHVATHEQPISTHEKSLSTHEKPISTREQLEKTQLSASSKIKATPELAETDKTACSNNQNVLKLYMYDMPPDFHFGLLGWNGSNGQRWPNVSNPAEIPSYPGGLNTQHSIEYWLTLDLLASELPGLTRHCHAIRVHNESEADAIFVPFFASLSYNRYSKVPGKKKVSMNTVLQHRVVNYLMRKPEWKRSKGKNHIIVAHHPNSLLYARKRLFSARFILADFARYPPNIANLDKDVIAPYKHIVRSIDNESSHPFKERPILAHFQGAIYRKDGGAIRQELYYLLKDEEDIHFTFGSIAQRNSAREAGQGMGNSKFCLNIAGDTPSSNRLFDAIVSHCVPVIISDDIELPYEDVLDYSEFAIFVLGSDALKPGFLVQLLRDVQEEEWTRMWERLKQVAPYFEFRFPSEPEDAVDMIWQAVARKLKNVRLSPRKRKYRRPEALLGGDI